MRHLPYKRKIKGTGHPPVCAHPFDTHVAQKYFDLYSLQSPMIMHRDSRLDSLFIKILEGGLGLFMCCKRIIDAVNIKP